MTHEDYMRQAIDLARECLTGGPHRSPAERVRWGKAERRSERASAIGGSEGYAARDAEPEPPAPAAAPAPDMGMY